MANVEKQYIPTDAEFIKIDGFLETPMTKEEFNIFVRSSNTDIKISDVEPVCPETTMELE